MIVREDQRPPRRWLGGLGGIEWRSEERTYVALLDALTRDRIDTAVAESERVATSRRSLTDVQEDQQRMARDELAEARSELDDFRVALEDARVRSGADGRAEVAYDSANPVEDAHADVLIQYLVRPGYAEVRTEEPEAGHYVYHVRVSWDRLRALAEEQGQPLVL